jgi:hypothetical protein
VIGVAEYEAPRLEAGPEAYETPQLLDVEEVVSETSGCYTLGICIEAQEA